MERGYDMDRRDSNIACCAYSNMGHSRHSLGGYCMKLSELRKVLLTNHKVGIWTSEGMIFDGRIGDYDGADCKVAMMRGRADAGIDIWMG